MNKGILIFAHNSRDVDYATLSLISGGLAKKHLETSVSLATDSTTLEWIESSRYKEKFQKVFDNIIEIEKPVYGNSRVLYDGQEYKKIPFINQNRSRAWDVTPYERTLLIDSDFLIFSNRLSHYWNVDSDILIGESFKNIRNDTNYVLDQWISETAPHLYWATTFMFTKNESSKIFFDLVDHIRDFYKHYSDVYRFNPLVYRNDISFSIAKHITDSFLTDKCNNLPPILSAIDKDELIEVKKDGNLIFIIKEDNFKSISLKNMDIHIMNKQSIIRNVDLLLDLI
jgi:hypothetical protein